MYSTFNRLVSMLETDVIGETVLVLVLFVAVWTDSHGNADMLTEVRSHSIILEKIVIIGSPIAPSLIPL